ncbi:MAG: phosphotransferase, partial [Coxiellaceae bacterium]|nr:phosphotransferase [Coxiellaceae bacterium]
AIAKLHSGKAFPKSPSNFDLLEQISQGVKQYFPNDRYVEAGISKISLLRSLLDCDSDQRPSHRDLHGFNVLYDGQQYYLIDWESAGNESLYFDLAVVINTLLFKILHIESTLLSAYFNSESTAEQLAKLKLMRIFAYLFYGFLLLYIGTSIQEERLNQDQIEGLKTFSEFIEQQIELNQPLTAGQYLKCGYASFIAGLNQFETTDTEKAIELLSKAN